MRGRVSPRPSLEQRVTAGAPATAKRPTRAKALSLPAETARSVLHSRGALASRVPKPAHPTGTSCRQNIHCTGNRVVARHVCLRCPIIRSESLHCARKSPPTTDVAVLMPSARAIPGRLLPKRAYRECDGDAGAPPRGADSRRTNTSAHSRRRASPGCAANSGTPHGIHGLLSRVAAHV